MTSEWPPNWFTRETIAGKFPQITRSTPSIVGDDCHLGNSLLKLLKLEASKVSDDPEVDHFSGVFQDFDGLLVGVAAQEDSVNLVDINRL